MQWAEFRDSAIRDTRAPHAFGVICGNDGQRVEYMTAIEVADFESLPGDTGRMRVPAQHYAVFATKDHVSAAADLWPRIMFEWLPASDYEDAETPAFELYTQSYDPETGDGGFEIWFPVRRRTSHHGVR
jgi:AraC family transcriptional regulator